MWFIILRRFCLIWRYERIDILSTAARAVSENLLGGRSCYPGSTRNPLKFVEMVGFINISFLRISFDFETDTIKIHRKFSYKKVARIGFLKFGPKIAVDELSVHTIVQMVMRNVIYYSASFLPNLKIWAYRHLVYSRACGKWEFTGWPELLSRVNSKSS